MSGESAVTSKRPISGAPIQVKASNLPPPSLLEGAALFLDFDGTLVDLADTPGAIRIPAALPSLPLFRSGRARGGLANVSGRAIPVRERRQDCSGIAVSASRGPEIRLAAGAAIPLAFPFDTKGRGSKIERFAAQHSG